MIGKATRAALAAAIALALAASALGETLPQRRAEQTLWVETMHLCAAHEVFIGGVPITTCYDAQVGCWWRHEYNNGKCWDVYWLHYVNPSPKLAWSERVRAAWWNAHGDITHRGPWKATRHEYGPPQELGPIALN